MLCLACFLICCAAQLWRFLFCCSTVFSNASIACTWCTCHYLVLQWLAKGCQCCRIPPLRVTALHIIWFRFPTKEHIAWYSSSSRFHQLLIPRLDIHILLAANIHSISMLKALLMLLWLFFIYRLFFLAKNYCIAWLLRFFFFILTFNWSGSCLSYWFLYWFLCKVWGVKLIEEIVRIKIDV